MSDRRDRGFTLPEVLITIVLIALIAGVLSAIFTIVVRTRPAAEARVDDARSLLGVTNWFPADVNSTPVQPTSLSTLSDWWNINPGAASGCLAAPAGDNLIRLRWTEERGTTSTFEASYRLVDDGGWRIQRISCELGGPADVQTLTSALPEPSQVPVTVTLTEGDRDVGGTLVRHIIGASMTITTLEGDSLTVDSLSESPNETLPPAPTVVTSPTVPTTVVNATPVAPDIWVTLTIGGGPFTITLPAIDADGPTLEYVSNTNANPDVTVVPILPLDLTLEAVGGTAGPIGFFEYVVSDSIATATGRIHLTLQDSGTPSTSTTTTTTTTTTVPCTVGTFVVSPNSVENQPKTNGNNDTNSELTDEVTVTVSGLNGDCGGLQLRWSFKADPYPPAQEQSQLFGGSSTVTFERLATERWEDGIHTMYLFDGLRGVAVGTAVTLEVT